MAPISTYNSLQVQSQLEPSITEFFSNKELSYFNDSSNTKKVKMNTNECTRMNLQVK